jgi:hypothetical protein
MDIKKYMDIAIVTERVKRNRAELALCHHGGIGCEVCSKKSVKSYCAACSEFICDDCKTTHNDSKATRDHTVELATKVMGQLWSKLATCFIALHDDIAL